MNRLLLIIWCIGVGALAPLAAQVLPGDANNNGRVDHYDILSIGYAFGAVGPSRIQDSLYNQELAIQLLWPQDFPDGLNFAYADANGNGWVEVTDFLAVAQNYGLEHLPLLPLSLPVGVPGLNPAIAWAVTAGETPMQMPAGEAQSINLVFDQLGFPADSLNGLAFTLLFDDQLFADFTINLSDNALGADNAALVFKRYASPGRIDVAITRFGLDPRSPSGPIGTVNLIVVDDLIEFLTDPLDTLRTCLRVANIMALRSDYTYQPITADTLCIGVFQDNVSSISDPHPQPRSILTPNPTHLRQVNLSASADFQQVELLDVLGRVWPLYVGAPTGACQLPLPAALPPGLYWVRASDHRRTWLTPLVLE